MFFAHEVDFVAEEAVLGLQVAILEHVLLQVVLEEINLVQVFAHHSCRRPHFLKSFLRFLQLLVGLLDLVLQNHQPSKELERWYITFSRARISW